MCIYKSYVTTETSRSKLLTFFCHYYYYNSIQFKILIIKFEFCVHNNKCMITIKIMHLKILLLQNIFSNICQFFTDISERNSCTC